MVREELGHSNKRLSLPRPRNRGYKHLGQFLQKPSIKAANQNPMRLIGAPKSNITF